MSDNTTKKSNDQSRDYSNQGNLPGPGGSYGNQGSQGSESGNWNMGGGMDMLGDQWNQMRSKIKQRWPQLRDQELMQTQGNFDRLCSVIQQHTGESRRMIEPELRQIIERQPESEART